jgi:hypothetical protein
MHLTALPLVALAPALHVDLAGLSARLPGARVTEGQDEPAAVAVVTTPGDVRSWLRRGAAVIAVAPSVDRRVELLDAGAVTAADRCGSTELAARVAAVLRRLAIAPTA